MIGTLDGSAETDAAAKNMSTLQFSKEEGIQEATLYCWCNILKEAENGVPALELRPKHSISSVAFYQSNFKYRRTDASLIFELTQLQCRDRCVFQSPMR